MSSIYLVHVRHNYNLHTAGCSNAKSVNVVAKRKVVKINVQLGHVVNKIAFNLSCEYET